MKHFTRLVARWPRLTPSKDAGRGPEWAQWLVGCCALMAVIAYYHAVKAVWQGTNPRFAFTIFFVSLAAASGALWRLKLVWQSVCALGLAGLAAILLAISFSI